MSGSSIKSNTQIMLEELKLARDLADEHVLAAKQSAGIFGSKGGVYHAESVRDRAHSVYAQALSEYIDEVKRNGLSK